MNLQEFLESLHNAGQQVPEATVMVMLPAEPSAGAKHCKIELTAYCDEGRFTAGQRLELASLLSLDTATFRSMLGDIRTELKSAIRAAQAESVAQETEKL